MVQVTVVVRKKKGFDWVQTWEGKWLRVKNDTEMLLEVTQQKKDKAASKAADSDEEDIDTEEMFKQGEKVEAVYRDSGDWAVAEITKVQA